MGGRETKEKKGGREKQTKINSPNLLIFNVIIILLCLPKILTLWLMATLTVSSVRWKKIMVIVFINKTR